jgi:hypothetical protein
MYAVVKDIAASAPIEVRIKPMSPLETPDTHGSAASRRAGNDATVARGGQDLPALDCDGSSWGANSVDDMDAILV